MTCSPIVRLAVILSLLVGCGFAPAAAPHGDDDVAIDAAIDGVPDAVPDALHDAPSTPLTCATDNGNCPASCDDRNGTVACYAPRTCAELVAHGISPAGANQALYLDGNATQPWTAYCATDPSSATAPLLEYLPLTGTNQSVYLAGGASHGTDVVTKFTKVRIYVASKQIDINDRAFSTSTGSLTHSDSGIVVTHVPFGVAMTCQGPSTMNGTASIDLTSTRFAISSSFAGGGSGFAAATTPSNANQKWLLHGGGYCGWNAPTNAPTNPFNDIGVSKLITLTYH